MEMVFVLRSILLLVLVLIFLGWLGQKAFFQFRRIIHSRGCSIKSLAKDFDQKMWMTIGLGIAFSTLYTTLILLLSWFIEAQSWLALFWMMYEEPVLFIYAGLFVFASISLLIYLIRMIIKYFFLTRHF